MNGKAE